MLALWGTGRGNIFNPFTHLHPKKPIDLFVSWRGTFCRDPKIKTGTLTLHQNPMGQMSSKHSTFRELLRIRSRWSLSLSRGSLTRRTNERLYSRRLVDLWSAEEARLVCSRARYKSPRESACILHSCLAPIGWYKWVFHVVDILNMYVQLLMDCRFYCLFICKHHFLFLKETFSVILESKCIKHVKACLQILLYPLYTHCPLLAKPEHYN